MATQGEYPASRSADVTQQHLENCGRTDDLRSLRMLCPTDGVAACSSSLATRSAGECLRGLQKEFLRNTTVLFDHVGRVTREVPLQNLEHATRMLKRRISLVLVRVAC